MRVSARCDLLPEHREAVLRVVRAQGVPINPVRTRIFRARETIDGALA